MDTNLEWKQQDRQEVIEKILSLSDDQIWNLFQKTEIGIVDSFDEVLTEIRENREDSMNLDMLLDEVPSKQRLEELIGHVIKPTQ